MWRAGSCFASLPHPLITKHESSRKLREEEIIANNLFLSQFPDAFWKKKEAQQRKGEWKGRPKGCRRDRFFRPNHVGLFSQNTLSQETLPLLTSITREHTPVQQIPFT